MTSRASIESVAECSLRGASPPIPIVVLPSSRLGLGNLRCYTFVSFLAEEGEVREIARVFPLTASSVDL